MQVNYPHEAMLFKQTGQQLARFVITLALNLAILIGLRLTRPEAFAVGFPSWGMLLFPLVTLPLFFLAAAIGLFVAMVNVVAVDVTRFFNMGLGFMMYLTPVIYPADTFENELVLAIMRWNPLTYLVASCRDILIYGHLYQHNWIGYGLSSLLAIVAFLISWRLFYVSEGQLVERMV